MTTYNTYQEAKIANPEYAIFEYQRNFGTDKEILDLFDIQGREMKECNPADYCMTVDKFLADGHKLEIDDVIFGEDEGDVDVVSSDLHCRSFNMPVDADRNIYILRAAALENIPTETPEEKEVLDSIESAGEVEWSNGDSVKYHNKHEGEGGLLTFVGIHPTHKDHAVLYGKHLSCGYMSAPLSMLSKPETPKQREDRERLEAAYDLYEESQLAIGCIGYDDFDSFKKPDIQVKFWLSIVDKTKYRKEKAHDTN